MKNYKRRKRKRLFLYLRISKMRNLERRRFTIYCRKRNRLIDNIFQLSFGFFEKKVAIPD